MVFWDRQEAGRQLAKRLQSYRGANAIVLALPRGGVVVGYEVARALEVPLDVIVARKLGAPGYPEFGIGAIAPGGVLIFDEPSLRVLKVTKTQMDALVARETKVMEERVERFRGSLPFPRLEGRTVILVDDGLATGVTARAAIRSLRAARPGKIVLAVPVCAYDTSIAVGPEADELVCLATPLDFKAVGMWYRNFTQVSNDEVVELLEASRDAMDTLAKTKTVDG